MSVRADYKHLLASLLLSTSLFLSAARAEDYASCLRDAITEHSEFHRQVNGGGPTSSLDFSRAQQREMQKALRKMISKAKDQGKKKFVRELKELLEESGEPRSNAEELAFYQKFIRAVLETKKAGVTPDDERDLASFNRFVAATNSKIEQLGLSDRMSQVPVLEDEDERAITRNFAKGFLVLGVSKTVETTADNKEMRAAEFIFHDAFHNPSLINRLIEASKKLKTPAKQLWDESSVRILALSNRIDKLEVKDPVERERLNWVLFYVSHEKDMFAFLSGRAPLSLDAGTIGLDFNLEADKALRKRINAYDPNWSNALKTFRQLSDEVNQALKVAS